MKCICRQPVFILGVISVVSLVCFAPDLELQLVTKNIILLNFFTLNRCFSHLSWNYLPVFYSRLYLSSSSFPYMRRWKWWPKNHIPIAISNHTRSCFLVYCCQNKITHLHEYKQTRCDQFQFIQTIMFSLIWISNNFLCRWPTLNFFLQSNFCVYFHTAKVHHLATKLCLWI